MTDRELLELAAKAAGIEVGGEDFVDPIDRKYSDVLGLWVNPPYGYWWNPLGNNGDALRLAVKLEMQLRLRHSENEVSVYGAPDGRTDEGVRGDPYAATCRAIVRAAAEIGRST